jgi:hypothetical protein
MSVIDDIKKNILKSGGATFASFVDGIWSDDKTGWKVVAVEGREVSVHPDMNEEVRAGVSYEYLKKFPVIRLKNEVQNVDLAKDIVTSIFLGTAYGAAAAAEKTALVTIMDAKINTMMAAEKAEMKTDKAKTVVCGSIGHDYVRLTNKTDDINVEDFFTDFSDADKCQIGVDLIRVGLDLKRENAGGWVAMTLTSGKVLKIYFPKANDEGSRKFLTHGRCAVATARETSAFLASKEDMPALGLNLGWQAIAEEVCISKLNKVFQDANMPLITNQIVYMIAIPKVKPHKIMNLSSSEAHLMLSFHVINDAYNSKKRKDKKYEGNFTSEVYSKMVNLGIDVKVPILKKILNIVTKPCLSTMRHKGISLVEMISQTKGITRPIKTWQALEDETKFLIEEAAADETDVSNLVISDKKKRTE